MKLSRMNLLDCVNSTIETLRQKMGDDKFLFSELPDKSLDNAMRSINKPEFQKPLDQDDDLIPWPKIDGSLPIQSPTSVSPKGVNPRLRSKKFQPAIVGYKRRNSQAQKALNEKKKDVQLDPIDKSKWKNRAKSPTSENSQNPQTIVLKIPTSESESKDENSESEETQKQDTTREARSPADLRITSKRPGTMERSSRRINYPK